MSGFTSVGIAFNTVTTDQQCPLGFELTAPNGDNGNRVWVYVYNDDAASFVEGTIVSRDAATATYDAIIAPLNTPTMAVMGVAQHLIAAGSYGFVLKKGTGSVLADTGGFTINTALVVGNAVVGRADNAAVTTHAFAYSTAVGAATATAACYINCPG